MFFVFVVSCYPWLVEPAGVELVAASDVAHLPGAFVDELADQRLLPDAARHEVGAGQRDGRASDIPSRRGEINCFSIVPFRLRWCEDKLL